MRSCRKKKKKNWGATYLNIVKLLILEKESHMIWKKKLGKKMDFPTSFEWIQSKRWLWKLHSC